MLSNELISLCYQWEDTVNENYPHVVYEEHCKACDAEESKSTSVDNDNSDKLEGVLTFFYFILLVLSWIKYMTYLQEPFLKGYFLQRSLINWNYLRRYPLNYTDKGKVRVNLGK